MIPLIKYRTDKILEQYVSLLHKLYKFSYNHKIHKYNMRYILIASPQTYIGLLQRDIILPQTHIQESIKSVRTFSGFRLVCRSWFSGNASSRRKILRCRSLDACHHRCSCFREHLRVWVKEYTHRTRRTKQYMGSASAMIKCVFVLLNDTWSQ